MRALPLVVVTTLVLQGCGFGLTLEPEGAVVEDGTEAPDPGDDPSGGDAEGLALPATAVELDGKLYAISPDAMRVTQPPGLDGIFDQVLDRDVLVYVESESSTTLELAVALAGPNGRQDPCEAVRAFPAGDWTENPVFDVGPGSLTTQFGGHPATFRDLALSGVFDEYAFSWREGTLSALLDTRELEPALGDVGDACGLVEDLGGSCVACDDGEPACFELRIEEIVAELVDAPFEVAPDTRGC